jgi:hypothetical protein
VEGARPARQRVVVVEEEEAAREWRHGCFCDLRSVSGRTDELGRRFGGG